jgi:hypothetical protein
MNGMFAIESVLRLQVFARHYSFIQGGAAV